MSVVGMVVHNGRPEASEIATKTSERLTAEGHEVRMLDERADADGLDLAVSLGGDGTMLRTVDIVGPREVPVLGINVGHLGYLTECDPSALDGALERFFAGDYDVERRMTLEVSIAGSSFPPVTALNEAWLEKRSIGHTVRMAVRIGGRPFTTYAADGLIVCTPTGSTAYNLSVRGPIVSPSARVLVMTPVSPHQLFNHSLVLDGERDVVEIEVLEGDEAALLVDGRALRDVGRGERVVCQAGKHDALLVRFTDHDFHQILKAKFGLLDR